MNTSTLREDKKLSIEKSIQFYNNLLTNNNIIIESMDLYMKNNFSDIPPYIRKMYEKLTNESSYLSLKISMLNYYFVKICN